MIPATVQLQGACWKLGQDPFGDAGTPGDCSIQHLADRIPDSLRCEASSLNAARAVPFTQETRGGIAELKLLPRCRSRRLIVLTREAGLVSVFSRGPAVRGYLAAADIMRNKELLLHRIEQFDAH